MSKTLLMKTMIFSMIIMLTCTTLFAQEKKSAKGQGTGKHTPANKDYDKPVSKASGKIQVRKSGNNTSGLADTTRQLMTDEHNVMNRTEDFSASGSGTPSMAAPNDGLLSDGTNTAQRASYNMAGSPVPSSRPLIRQKNADTDKKAASEKNTKKKKK
jgi:hypothetical protein